MTIRVGKRVVKGAHGEWRVGRTVQAARVGGGGSELTWRVRGWRNSSRVIDEVASALAAGRTPAPDEALCVAGETVVQRHPG
jgi:hypothetical protein